MANSKQIRTIEWESRLNEITPSDMRVGKDILLIDTWDDSGVKDSPFKANATSCIIYKQGEVRFRLNMREFHAKSPAMVILPCDAIVENIWHSDNVQTHVIVMSEMFSNSLFSAQHNMLPMHKIICDNPVLPLGENLKVMTSYYVLLRNLVQNATKMPYALEAIRHLTLTFFYAFTGPKHKIDAMREKKNRKDEIYSQFITLLRTHYKRERELSFYAERMFLTPKYLSRAVCEATGKSATEWIEEYVTTEAKALLHSTNQTIQQISDDLGFESQSHFGKYFKRVVGSSPRAWRQQLSNKRDK